MSSDLFDIVRSHLLETNALEEAEELMLRSLLDKKSKPAAPAPKPTLRSPVKQPAAVTSNTIDALRVSDLLGGMEESMYPRRRVIPAAHPLPAKEHTLEELEKITEEEIWMLEQKKLALKRQMEDKKARAERERILQELLTQPTEEAQHKASIKKEAITASAELQRKLLELSDQHHETMAQQRAHALEAQRELQLLNSGKWSASSSNLLGAKLGRVPLSQEDVSMSEDLIRKSRVQVLLSKMQNEDEILLRKHRIEALRDKDKQVQHIEDMVLAQRIAAQQPKEEVKPSPRPSSLVSEDGKIDRKLPVSEFLDRWLLEDVRPAVPTNAMASSHVVQAAEQMTQMELELQRLTEENRRLKAGISVERPTSSSEHRGSSANGRRRRDREAQAVAEALSPEGGGMRGAKEIQPERQLDGIRFNDQNGQPHDPYGHGPAGLRSQQPQPFAPQPFQQQSYPQQYPQYQQPYQQQYQQQYQQYPQQYPMQQYPAPAVDPVQQSMLAQMQKIAEQLEKETNSITALSAPPGYQQMGMGGYDGYNQQRYNPLVQNIHDPHAPQAIQMGKGNQPDRDMIYKLQRDDPSNAGSRISRVEQQKQEEIRLLQYELEKMKHQKELDDFRAQYDTQRVAKMKEDEHKHWLEEQKRELQAIKMKQVLMKEQKLLQFQTAVNEQDVLSDSEEMMDPSQKRLINASSNYNLMDHVREECGVGISPMPLDLVKGITVIVDGCLIRKSLQALGNPADLMFRVALGAYDKSGEKSLARLTATGWQHLDPMSAPAGPLQIVDELLMITLRPNDLPGVLTGDNSNANGVGIKCLVELQVKGGGGEGNRSSTQKSVGWAVLSLITQPNPSANKVYLNNGTWRVDIRSGISDPHVDANNLPTADNDSNCFLLRVLNYSENYRASGWKLAEFVKTMPNADLLGLFTNANDAALVRAQSELRLNPISSTSSLLRASMKSGREPRAVSQSGRTPQQASLAPQLATIPSVPSMPSFPGFPVSRKAPQTPSEPGTPSARPMSSSMKSLDMPLSMLSTRMPKVGEDDNDDLMASPRLQGGPERQTWWNLGPSLGPCSERYQRGDGIDIYIDRCMFLPDNSTLTRVSLRLYSSSKEQIGSVFEGISLPDSPAISPIFKMKAECRGNLFNATATALMRFDTLDSSTLVPVSSAYACMKLFASRDRVQPKQSNDTNAYINTGAFQLRMYAGRIPVTLQSFDDTMLQTMPIIPCATVLVRILAAPKSADGISTLSKDEFPQEDWQRLGLDVPAPNYSSGAYYGALCEPSGTESQAYEAKSPYLSLNVETAILQAMNARKGHDLPERPNDPKPEVLLEWMKSLLPPLDKMRRMIDYTLAVPYSVEAGVAVKVVQLFNMPEGSMFSSSKGSAAVHKVIMSVSPPALFYKDPPLFDGVQFTRSHVLDGFIRAPRYLDSYAEFLPAEMSFNLYLILDIRIIRVEPKKKNKATDTEPVNIKVEPAGTRKSFWTILPLARERCPGQGFRHTQSGYFQLPLIEGAVPAGEIFRAVHPFKEVLNRLGLKKQLASSNATGEMLQQTPLKLNSDFASVLVKVYNPLLRDLVLPELDPPEVSGAAAQVPDTMFLIPMLDAAAAGQTGQNVARTDKFAYSATKYVAENRNAGKTLAQVLPAVLPEHYDLMKNINDAFTASTGITSTV